MSGLRHELCVRPAVLSPRPSPVPSCPSLVVLRSTGGVLLLSSCYSATLCPPLGRRPLHALAKLRVLLWPSCCPLATLANSVSSSCPLGVLLLATCVRLLFRAMGSLLPFPKAYLSRPCPLSCLSGLSALFITAFSGDCPLLGHAAFPLSTVCSGVFSCGYECNSGAAFQA